MNNIDSATGTASPARPDLLTRRPRLGLGPIGVGVRVLVAVVVLFGANAVVGWLAGLVALVPGGSDLLSGTTLASLAVFVLLQAGMLGLVVLAVGLWLRFVERRQLRDVGWRVTRWSGVWLLLGTIAAGALTVAAVAVLPSTGPVADPESFGSGPVWFGVAAVVSQSFLLQGIPEELLFRGWLLSTLRSRPIRAIVVTTLSFTLIHLLSSGGQQSLADHVLYLALPFGFSLLAVGLILWTRSLWVAVGVHGGFHLGNATAVVLLPAVDAALSWMAIGGLHTLVGVTLIVIGLRRGRAIALER